ncbi:DUF7283 family protein [Haloplanus halophilus]|uniref:DUF7283 family protein n=1 Tax=Haloplanus halophilus TaxID=2949993 RepID=UPI002041292F|nr:hypothetical protein [Haloplanus sp. GDY1]
MFDVPVDAWYAWLGLSLASVALFGVGVTLPTSPPPAAADAADTVDRAAGAAAPVTAEHPLDAREVRIEPTRLGLRNDAGTTHATFAFGPVTPAARRPGLTAVLRGAPPSSRFDSAGALCAAASTARDRPARWRKVDGPLIVRRVVWEGCDVTLVA